MGFCISNQLIWFSSKSVICDPPDTADAESVASSKFGSASNSSKNRNKFAGFTRESANVNFTQQLKNDSGVVLKPCKR